LGTSSTGGGGASFPFLASFLSSFLGGAYFSAMTAYSLRYLAFLVAKT